MDIKTIIKKILVCGLVVYLLVSPFVAFIIMFYSGRCLTQEILSRALPDELLDAEQRLEVIILLQGLGLYLAGVYIILLMRKKRSRSDNHNAG